MSSSDPETAALAEQLAEVGREVRAAVSGARHADDAAVVRTEGGDDVFGIDARADEVLLAALARRCGERWPGVVVIEGFDDPQPVGDPAGPWTYLADPIDGSRGLLAGLRSAWVLLGAGREASTLEDLEVGVAVELPTERAALGRVGHADRSGHLVVEDDDLVGEQPPRPVVLQPKPDDDLARTFVTVVRLTPGGHGPIGVWADEHLAGLEVYDDLYPCTGGQMMAVASGSSAAALDPRPLLHEGSFASHPYDLAALVLARAAGVVVEALPPGPLLVPLDTDTPVAWAAYANHEVAARLRPSAGSLGVDT
jgi:fructose-1,6-bisphosphatase/inositol monophosphatase family enzyme